MRPFKFQIEEYKKYFTESERIQLSHIECQVGENGILDPDFDPNTEICKKCKKSIIRWDDKVYCPECWADMT